MNNTMLLARVTYWLRRLAKRHWDVCLVRPGADEGLHPANRPPKLSVLNLRKPKGGSPGTIFASGDGRLIG